MNKGVKVMTENNLDDFLLQNTGQYFGVPDMKFQYEIGDSVILKAMATVEGRAKSGIPGFKRSLGRFLRKLVRKINIILVSF